VEKNNGKIGGRARTIERKNELPEAHADDLKELSTSRQAFKKNGNLEPDSTKSAHLLSIDESVSNIQVAEDGTPWQSRDEKNDPNREANASLQPMGTSSNGADKSSGLQGCDKTVTTAYDAWIRIIPNPETRQYYAREVRHFLQGLKGKPLNRITREDIEQFIHAPPEWNARHSRKCAVKSFLEHAVRKIPTFNGKIGERPDPPPIVELSPEEKERFHRAKEKKSDKERLATDLMIQTGHRERAIMALPRTAPKMTPGGPVIEFPPKTQKNVVYAVVPISDSTYTLIQKYLTTHNDEKLIPCDWKRPGKWLYFLVKRIARDANISTRTYPHLFRHMKALQLRREKIETDIVLNQMGWRSSKQYDMRYGRRQAYETVESVRKLLPSTTPKKPQPPQPQHTDTATAISELAGLLKEGKIDVETFQAGIVALTRKETQKVEGMFG
jgi:site-specific recombinase XerD